MTTTADAPGRHPVAEFAERLDARLDDLAEAALWSMSDSELDESLLSLTRSLSRAEALRLRLLAEAEHRGVTGIAAAANAAVHVAGHTRQTRRAAKADLKLAQSLEQHAVLAAGMAAGHVNPAQARVIVRALDALPGSGEFAVDAEQRALAEKHLVAEAAHHDADALTVLGRRIFEVVCPDLADAYEGRKLEAEEAHAARKTSFTMSEDHQGLCHFRGRIPARHGAMLRKAIQALTNPTHANSIDTTLPGAVRDGLALTQIIEAIDAHWLPTHGGVGATVVVTMTLDQLRKELTAAGVCPMDTGHRITAGEARRLACAAGIIPVVLGGPSVVLDAGTKRRYHSETQRIALAVRDRGCTAQGCDAPPAMCHAHHDVLHSRGGATSVANGRLLCGHHHRRIHDPAYRHQIGPDNKVTFHRRT